jgi:translation initiation factor IF-2
MGIRTAYPQGAQVEHGRFGLGTVLSINEEHIVIKFDDFGEKKFVTTIVLTALKKSDRQPPVEKRSSRSRKAKAAAAAPAAPAAPAAAAPAAPAAAAAAAATTAQ